ncbi:hypothetical protein [Bdellovibrio sp. HCB2-146]|uniref:hypothetical protein n=1 Tax=Bdellovibrio sp. HCB2-146 TaxID=3394362 RepID=UPI0039BC992D
MKILFLIMSVILGSALAGAKTICTYTLKDQAYWEDATGTLNIGAKKFRCESLMLRQAGDMITLCKDVRAKVTKPQVYDYIVSFDGAEGNYFVTTDLDGRNVICSGIAKNK